MRIDIHTHTKKCKQGDSEKRNIEPERFDEIIRSTDVRILAITNHNHFDLNQFNEITEAVTGVCQIWPGVELDIEEEGRKAHLLVIVNPKNVEDFNEAMTIITEGETPDNFNISLKEVVEYFDDLDAIYIAHYFGKSKSLSDQDIKILTDNVSDSSRILKEATNSISAGIYISHGHRSIYGSDIHDWDKYEEISKTLPELRLPVESFDHFCLLLKKDNATINTLLNKKEKEEIKLTPFKNADEVNISIYNDINILFGSKGTGKSEILEALSKRYNNLGFTNRIFKSNDETLSDKYDIKGKDFDANVSEYGIDECDKEIEALCEAWDESVTSISAYTRFFTKEETNKISKELKIKNLKLEDKASSQRSLEAVKKILLQVRTSLLNLSDNSLFKEIVGDELLEEFSGILERIIEKLEVRVNSDFVELHSIKLFNQIVNVFIEELARKTGAPQKPKTTGFKKYAQNRIELELKVNKILKNLQTVIPVRKIRVGSLGEKGELHCETHLIIQEGDTVKSDYTAVKKATKIPQRKFSKKLFEIRDNLYSDALYEEIRELNEIEGGNEINGLSDLLIFYRHFSIGSQEYTPSTGESSMILLQNELLEDKEIYLIDEPEKSLGNDYISEIIVPILKEKAKMGKKIIIATHDANIAVRTLPYNSIYRKYDLNGYQTFQGNPFSNDLICDEEGVDSLDWKEISMKTLEGGKEAFGERDKIYGNE